MKLNTVHPGVISLYYIILIIFSLIFDNIYYLFSLSIFITVLLYLQGKKEEIASILKYYIPMSLMIIILNPLFTYSGTTKIYIFNSFYITLESLVYGIIMALCLWIILLLLLSFNEYVDYQKILYLSSKHFATITMIGVMAMRFVPLLNNRLEEVNKIFTFDYNNSIINKNRIDENKINEKRINKIKNKINKIKNKINKIEKIGLMLAVVISWSLEDAMLTAKSMRTRGYGITTRTNYLKYNIDKIDIVLILIIFGAVVISLTGLYHGFGRLNIYPTINESFLQFPLTIYYIGFLVLLSPLIIIELVEKIMWKRNLGKYGENARNNSEKWKYGKKDYEKLNYKEIDYRKKDYEEIDYKKIDYGKKDYGDIDHGFN